MSRRKSYVDNAMNRRLGRVGMEYGSCVQSSSGCGSYSASGHGASFSGYNEDDYSSSRSSYSTSGRTYVDNASNRSLGRVGKAVGSHVVHRDGSATISSVGSSYPVSQKSYVDNSMNRSHGRVGKPVGSHVVHKDGSATISSLGISSGSFVTHKSYVDNSMNRSLGRVGKPIGSHVVHKDKTVIVSSLGDTVTTSSPKLYADNSMNRSLGRVGKPIGSHVIHKDGTTSISSCERDESLGSKDFYVDRKLGRVGKVKGSQVLHKDRTVTSFDSVGSLASRGSSRSFVDNAYNRKLGRVGQPLTHSRVRSKAANNQRKMEQGLLFERKLDEIVHILRDLEFRDPTYPAVVNARHELQRCKVEERWKKDGIAPFTNHAKAAQNMKEIIPFNEIDCNEKIGEGGFGKVYAGLWKKTVPIAFKKFIYQQITRKQQDLLMKEIKIFSALDHPNIVKMFGVVMERNNLGIVMEYLPKTLYHAIFIEEVKFVEHQKKKVVGGVVSAIEYLHTPNNSLQTPKPKIAHRDVKGQNILLDGKNVAKLCDFGLSVMKNSVLSSSSHASGFPAQGTPRYAAPEVLRGEVLTLSELMRSDINFIHLLLLFTKSLWKKYHLKICAPCSYLQRLGMAGCVHH